MIIPDDKPGPHNRPWPEKTRSPKLQHVLDTFWEKIKGKGVSPHPNQKDWASEAQEKRGPTTSHNIKMAADQVELLGRVGEQHVSSNSRKKDSEEETQRSQSDNLSGKHLRKTHDNRQRATDQKDTYKANLNLSLKKPMPNEPEIPLSLQCKY